MERIRYIFSEALVIWAYACVVSGYHAAAAAIALLAAGCTAAAFTKQEHLHLLPALTAVSLAGLILIRTCLLKEYLPSLGIVMISGCHTAVMFMHYYPRQTEKTSRGILLCGLLYTVLAILLPSAQFGTREMITLLLLIFGPSCGMYFFSLMKISAGAKPVAGNAAMR